jgi:RND family efflux transporter MFP subunit
VTTVQAAREHITSTIELTGTITARRQSRLSSRASGLILKLHVDAGSKVKAGDVLAELDPDLVKLALERVKVEKEQAAAELAEAKRQVEEVRDLTKLGGFSKSEAETRESTVRVRTAALNRTEVQIREQSELLARHQLIAPFDGVVSQKLTEEGEWVQTGTPVVTLVETGSLRLDVQAPQEMYGQIENVTDIKVTLDAHSAAVLKGKVATLVPVKDPVSRTFLVRLELEDPRQLAAAGMSARAVFAFRGREPVMQVPRDAVVRFPDGSTKVWVVQKDATGDTGTVRPVAVKLGQSLAEHIEILEGLEGQPTVVLRGNEGLREGQRVKLLPAPRKAGTGTGTGTSPAEAKAP